jgi:lipoyl(octanoyl) transferase
MTRQTVHPRTTPVIPARWILWADHAQHGVANMATDLALLDTVPTDAGIWRWYGWSAPTVSFGRNERTVGRFDVASLAAAALPAVRRPTGGRALLHWREVTYSVALPLPRSVPWRDAYEAVNALLLATLHRAGVPARRADHGVHVPPNGPVCFDAPAEGEITLDGRKLLGSAVWREGDRYLQHGSILVHDDQGLLAGASAVPLAPPPAATLAGVLSDRVDHCREALVRACTAVLEAAGPLSPFSQPPGWDIARASHERRLADPAWLWRR